MKKLITTILLTGALLTGGATAGAKANTIQSVGTFIGWADSNSFEAKIGKSYKTFRTSNGWYKKNLKSGKKYTYFYTTNKYGQNLIIKVNK